MIYTYRITANSCDTVYALFKDGIRKGREIKKATDLIDQVCLLDVDEKGYLARAAIVPSKVYEQFKSDKTVVYQELPEFCDKCHKVSADCFFDIDNSVTIH